MKRFFRQEDIISMLSKIGVYSTETMNQLASNEIKQNPEMRTTIIDCIFQKQIIKNITTEKVKYKLKPVEKAMLKEAFKDIEIIIH